LVIFKTETTNKTYWWCLKTETTNKTYCDAKNRKRYIKHIGDVQKEATHKTYWWCSKRKQHIKPYMLYVLLLFWISPIWFMCCFHFEYHQYLLCGASVFSISDMFNVLRPFWASPICLLCCVHFKHHRYV
jgi:hypothetical protein